MVLQGWLSKYGGWKNIYNSVAKVNNFPPRIGSVVGTDKFGNKYIENNSYFLGRNRMVEYSSDYYDGSQIPPEWHRWIHYMTEHPPTSEKGKIWEPKWKAEFDENRSGSAKQYVPASTTKQKIHEWDPTK